MLTTVAPDDVAQGSDFFQVVPGHDAFLLWTSEECVDLWLVTADDVRRNVEARLESQGVQSSGHLQVAPEAVIEGESDLCRATSDAKGFDRIEVGEALTVLRDMGDEGVGIPAQGVVEKEDRQPTGGRLREARTVAPRAMCRGASHQNGASRCLTGHPEPVHEDTVDTKSTSSWARQRQVGAASLQARARERSSSLS